MEQKMITIYCLIEEFLKGVMCKKEYQLAEISDAEVLFMGYIIWLVVRDLKMPYIAKRTSSALKVKSFNDTECEVIGYTKDKGKYKGLVGALECRLDNGIILKIGTGLSDDERKNPPKIGEVVTFKYKEFTKYGKPRFPVYLRVRSVR